ncbi:MAG: uroporphyrinogen-III synthase [Pseudomonadota bacterium]
MTDQTAPCPVIVTRARPGALETFERLTLMPCRPVLSPMLTITANTQVAPLDLRKVQGLIFTSANGVRAYADAGYPIENTAWCVGPATLLEAESAGFEDCRNADGNADDLADLINRTADPHAGELLHVANKAAAGQLVLKLTRAGFQVRFAPLYYAQRNQVMAPSASLALFHAARGIVLIHSAKGAEAFLAASRKIRTKGVWQIAAVSERAGKPLALGKGWPLYSAQKPNETALLSVLADRLAVI